MGSSNRFENFSTIHYCWPKFDSLLHLNRKQLIFSRNRNNCVGQNAGFLLQLGALMI
jgi:hypothetical protein